MCCDSACDGTCEACTDAFTGQGDGSCAPITNGTDPDGECADQGASTCGTDGLCDGAGACRSYGSGVVCQGSSCSGSTQTNPRTCDGSGTCQSGGTTACAPYLCAGLQCGTSCSSNNQCVSTAFCNGTSCVDEMGNGASCSASSECASGFCVDGVCCNNACTGNCRACSSAKKGGGSNGTCGDVAAGTDPDNDCNDQGASSCGNDGDCDGNGACRKYPMGTVCGAQTCSGSTQTNEDTCDGSGTCTNGGTTQCAPYACSGNSCRMQCSQPGHCTSGNVCIGTVCTPGNQPDGTPCFDGAQCQSGFCVDGVCCESVCTQLCYSCDESSFSPGLCRPIECGLPGQECPVGKVCSSGVCADQCE